MADALMAYTALGSRAGGELKTHGVAAAVMLREVTPFAMVDLRLDPADNIALKAVQQLLAFELPLSPGKTSEKAQRVAWWFGPDQWLIVAPPADAQVLMPALMEAARSAVDVSDLRAEFELAGPRAVDVLRKGCGIDLHPRAFANGDCALTSLARVRIGLRQIDERPAYRLLVERSVAPYLWAWLVDAMREFVGA
ncbi:MAG TPA: sarcosine oxidase subunit gamma family protein [Burkholderiales bacterium]|nr:sarcosine oxidase subunit gamma family protein [Burkholderiales bacterium]